MSTGARQNSEVGNGSVASFPVPAIGGRAVGSSSPSPLHPPMTTQPSSPEDPSNNRESASLSFTGFMDFTLLFGGDDGTFDSGNETQLSFSNGNGEESGSIHPVVTPAAQHTDNVDNGLSRTVSRGSDASSADDPQQQ